jgi:Mce-associated membrane protein
VAAEADTVDKLVEDIVASSEADLVTDAEVPPADDAAEPPEPGATQPGGRTWLQRNSRAVIVASVASFVAAGAFAGAAVQPYLADRATVATKMTIAATAAKAITTLWSYTPEDMDKLSDRSAQYLGGGFEEQYRKYVDAIAATNKQAKVTSSTQVVGAAVESLRDNEATAIVYTNTTSTTPQNNNIPSLKYLSYRLELQREGRDWRVTKMTTVTSLDLTPKLGL